MQQMPSKYCIGTHVSHLCRTCAESNRKDNVPRLRLDRRTFQPLRTTATVSLDHCTRSVHSRPPCRSLPVVVRCASSSMRKRPVDSPSQTCKHNSHRRSWYELTSKEARDHLVGCHGKGLKLAALVHSRGGYNWRFNIQTQR